jgi:hypothetical protein
MAQFTDEQLMAFADGEAPGALAQELRDALCGDAALRARLAIFEESRRVLRRVFNAKRAEPVPDRLMAAFGSAVQPAPRAAGRGWRNSHLALAASALAAVALSVGYFAGDRSESTLLPSAHFLTAALEGTASGDPFVEAREAGRQELVPIRTVRLQDGSWCREFRFAEVLARTVNKVHGLACRGSQGGWSMRALLPSSALPRAGADGAYRPASGVDAFSDLGPTESVDAAREATLIANGWR